MTARIEQMTEVMTAAASAVSIGAVAMLPWCPCRLAAEQFQLAGRGSCDGHASSQWWRCCHQWGTHVRSAGLCSAERVRASHIMGSSPAEVFHGFVPR